MTRGHSFSKRKSSISRKRIRLNIIEALEDRRMMAVASMPDQRLDISQPSAVFGYGNFQGTYPDLFSVTQAGRIEVAINRGDNVWQPLNSVETGIAHVLGVTTSLLNADPYDDLILLSDAQVTVLHANGLAGWQVVQTLPHTGIAAPVAHPQIQPATAFLGNDLAIDVVIPLPQANQLVVFHGGNAGLLSPEVYLNSGGTTPLSVASANVIGGPAQDLIVGHADGTLTFFEGDALGTFTLRSNLTQQLAVGALVSIRTSDLRQDGNFEIVVGGERGITILASQDLDNSEPVLVNGDFSNGLLGWSIETSGAPIGNPLGRVNAISGFAQFIENDSFLTSLSQTFTIPDDPQSIEFDLLSLGLEGVSPGAAPDAFEVSLLDTNSHSLVSTHSPNSTAFVNFVAGEAVSLAPHVSINGKRITLDISQLSPAISSTLFFDLIGQAVGQDPPCPYTISK